MDTLHEQKMKGFFYDVSRYTFNYLFDLGERSFVVRCTKNDVKELIKIFKIKNLKLTNKKEYFVRIILRSDIFDFEEAGECESISYEELIAILYRSASKEDDGLSLHTEKRLFKESLDYGFSNIN